MEGSVRCVCFRDDFTIKTVHAQKLASKMRHTLKHFYFSCWLLLLCLYVNCLALVWCGNPDNVRCFGTIIYFPAVPSPPEQSDECLEKLSNCQPVALGAHTIRSVVYISNSFVTHHTKYLRRVYTCSHTLNTHLSVSSKIVSADTASEKLVLRRRCCNVYMLGWHCAAHRLPILVTMQGLLSVATLSSVPPEVCSSVAAQLIEMGSQDAGNGLKDPTAPIST